MWGLSIYHAAPHKQHWRFHCKNTCTQGHKHSLWAQSHQWQDRQSHQRSNELTQFMTDIHTNHSAINMSRQCMHHCSGWTREESKRNSHQDRQWKIKHKGHLNRRTSAENQECNDEKLTEKALALWRLLSGDLILQTADILIKEALSVNTDWMNHIDINARIHCRMYSVIVHRVMKNHINITDEAAVRKIIEQQNNMLHARLHLQCIAWSKRALQTGKKYRSMIMKTASAEKVNTLIEKGLIEEQDIKTCELFERGCWMTQCFNCQQYEHTDRACKMSIKCRHCTESHDTKACSYLLDKIKRRCVVCMKSGHEAWVNICEACIEQKKRTRIAFFNKSVFYSQQTQTQSHVQHTQRTNISSTAQLMLRTEYAITSSASASASTISHSSDTLTQSQKQSLTDTGITFLNWSISISS